MLRKASGLLAQTEIRSSTVAINFLLPRTKLTQIPLAAAFNVNALPQRQIQAITPVNASTHHSSQLFLMHLELARLKGWLKTHGIASTENVRAINELRSLPNTIDKVHEILENINFPKTVAPVSQQKIFSALLENSEYLAEIAKKSAEIYGKDSDIEPLKMMEIIEEEVALAQHKLRCGISS